MIPKHRKQINTASKDSWGRSIVVEGRSPIFRFSSHPGADGYTEFVNIDKYLSVFISINTNNRNLSHFLLASSFKCERFLLQDLQDGVEKKQTISTPVFS